MAHSIILLEIDRMGGSDPGGCLGTLKGLMPALDEIENSQGIKTQPMIDVEVEAETIADGLSTNGLTGEALCSHTTTLGNLIELL